MPGSDDHWYGHGPKPEKRFYGTLGQDQQKRDNEFLEYLQKREIQIEQTRHEELKRKWPNYADLVEEIKHMEDDMLHRGIALDNLKEERNVLKKLLGIDDGEA